MGRDEVNALVKMLQDNMSPSELRAFVAQLKKSTKKKRRK